MTAGDLVAALPFILLAGGACLVLLGDLLVHADGRAWVALGAAAALATAVTAAVIGTGDDAFAGSLRRDGASVFFAIVVGGSTAAALLLATGYVTRTSLPAAEVTALTLFSASGAVLMSSAGDLLVVFVGLELLSLPLYALTGLPRAARHADESALKYFLLGAAASAVFAYGIALVYAATGSVAIGALAAVASPVGLAGIALLLAGLAFKAALVPFHFWAPDAYVSAPTPATAFMAVVAKLGAFAALLRFGSAVTAPSAAGLDWRASVAVLAAMTLVLGNLAALGQSSLKRLLAYSSIAHAGYIAIAAAAGVVASSAIAFYLAVYAALTLGAFGVITLLANDDPRVDDLHGLARRRPLLVVLLGVLLLGLTGLPPTAGFLAKVYVFEAAIGAQLAWLVLLGVLTSVVSAAYYLRVLFACLAEGEGEPAAAPTVAGGVVMLAALAVIVVGIVPGPLLDAVQTVRF
ncbi:MAG TPA: NADH-quinone oxidoreductase subunit N [Candidatus Limnocylindria bacterium]|nr:NADH-quinone oxidoreductase subunit N [Candidatus Limnocylindria bacterium]